MNLYQQFDERSFMQLGLNDQGFVAYATFCAEVSGVDECA